MNYPEICFEEAVSCFGLERVSLDMTHPLEFSITIYFPKFIIRNSNNLEHLITDLYVRLTMSIAHGTVRGLSGTRTIVTPEENASNYLQSHLHTSRRLGIFDEFCTGHSVITTLKADLASKFDVNKFAGLLFSLEEMVSWESKEGTPYISIDTISNRNSISSTISVPDLSEIKTRFLEVANLKFDLSITNSNTKLNVNLTKEQIEEILTALLVDKPHYYVEKVGTQYFKTGANTGDSAEDRGFTSWQFNGKHVKMLVRSLSTKSDNTIKVVHPHLTKLIHETITKEFEVFLEEKLS